MPRWTRFVTALVALLLAGVAPAAARQASPEASPVVVVEDLADAVLFSSTLRAEDRPPTPGSVWLYRATFRPGFRVTWPSSAPVRIAGWEYVVSGEYHVAVDGPSRIVHADGTAAEVPPGAEMTARPGETMVYPRAEASQTDANPGTEPVVVLGVQISAEGEPATPEPQVVPSGIIVENLGVLEDADWARVPPGPLTVTLHRVTVGPGASLPPQATDPAAPEIAYVEAGWLDWGLIDASGNPVQPNPLVLSTGQRVPFVVTPAGMQLVERNDGDTPLVLLVLSISPAT